MPLLSLSTELHLQIISYLDPDSTLRLSKVNSVFFRLLRTPESLREILSWLELHKSDLFDNADKQFFPCYGCLEACPGSEFTLSNIDRLYGNLDDLLEYTDPENSLNFPAFGLGGRHHGERRCKTCDEIAGGFFARLAQRQLAIEEYYTAMPSGFQKTWKQAIELASLSRMREEMAGEEENAEDDEEESEDDEEESKDDEAKAVEKDLNEIILYSQLQQMT